MDYDDPALCSLTMANHASKLPWQRHPIKATTVAHQLELQPKTTGGCCVVKLIQLVRDGFSAGYT